MDYFGMDSLKTRGGGGINASKTTGGHCTYKK